MKNLFSAFVLSLILSTTAQAAFSDVSTSHPHSAAIGYVKAQGMVKGYEDGTFRPDATINRVELLKILLEAENKADTTCAYTTYSDEVDGAWYGAYLQAASCLEIIGGYPDGSVKPGNAVVVAEAAKIIANGFGFSSSASGAWYAPFVDSLASRSALPTNLGGVGNELTRGQMAEMIYRLKTNRTDLASHTLASLEAGVAPSTGGEAAAPTAEAEEVDQYIDSLFDDVFEDDDLDLEGLLDF